MSLTGGNIDNSLQTIIDNTNPKTTLDIGHAAANARLNRIEGHSTFIMTTTRTNIGTVYMANSALPGSLDLTFPPSARTMSIASTSANDTGAGTGAVAVLIQGLDVNYKILEEVIVLTGQTEVDTVGTYLRINGLQVVSAGSGQFNDGNIFISDDTDTFVAGVPQTRVYCSIEVGWNLSMSSFRTVPANHQWLLLHTDVVSDATAAKPLFWEFCGIFTAAPTAPVKFLELITAGSETYINESTIMPEKTDILMKTKAASTTIDRATLWFHFLDVDLLLNPTS